MIGELLLLSVVRLSMAAGGSAAQPSYPERPILRIIPQETGGGSDTIGRYITQKLGDALGQQFVVDNRPGANTIVGMELVAKAAPDGYTLIMTSSTQAINATLYPESA